MLGLEDSDLDMLGLEDSELNELELEDSELDELGLEDSKLNELDLDELFGHMQVSLPGKATTYPLSFLVQLQVTGFNSNGHQLSHVDTKSLGSRSHRQLVWFQKVSGGQSSFKHSHVHAGSAFAIQEQSTSSQFFSPEFSFFGRTKAFSELLESPGFCGNSQLQLVVLKHEPSGHDVGSM